MARAEPRALDAHAVDEGAVAAREVPHRDAVLVDAEFAVKARDGVALDDEVVRRVGPDRDPVGVAHVALHRAALERELEPEAEQLAPLQELAHPGIGERLGLRVVVVVHRAAPS